MCIFLVCGTFCGCDSPEQETVMVSDTGEYIKVSMYSKLYTFSENTNDDSVTLNASAIKNENGSIIAIVFFKDAKLNTYKNSDEDIEKNIETKYGNKYNEYKENGFKEFSTKVSFTDTLVVVRALTDEDKIREMLNWIHFECSPVY